MGTNTDVSACLTPSTYDLYAASFLYVNVARLIFFYWRYYNQRTLVFVQSVFNKLFVYGSTYDLFRASFASIDVGK